MVAGPNDFPGSYDPAFTTAYVRHVDVRIELAVLVMNIDDGTV